MGETVTLSRRAYDQLMELASMERQWHAQKPLFDGRVHNGGPVAKLARNNQSRWAVHKNAQRLNPKIKAEHQLRQRWRAWWFSYLRKLAKQARARCAQGYFVTLYDKQRNTSQLVRLGAIHTYNTGIMVYAREYFVEPDGLVKGTDGYRFEWAAKLINPKRSECRTMGGGLTLKQARQVINGPLYYQGIPKEG